MDRFLFLTKHKRFFYHTFLFLLGGALYGCLEILWRGRTHFTMVLLGGLCFVLFALLRHLRLPLPIRCLLGALSVTLLEYFCGLIVNCLLHWHVWDYSREPFSLHGQICLKYSLFWLLLSLPAFGLAALCDRLLLFLCHKRENLPLSSDFTKSS